MDGSAWSQPSIIVELVTWYCLNILRGPATVFSHFSDTCQRWTSLISEAGVNLLMFTTGWYDTMRGMMDGICSRSWDVCPVMLHQSWSPSWWEKESGPAGVTACSHSNTNTTHPVVAQNPAMQVQLCNLSDTRHPRKQAKRAKNNLRGATSLAKRNILHRDWKVSARGGLVDSGGGRGDGGGGQGWRRMQGLHDAWVMSARLDPRVYR